MAFALLLCSLLAAAPESNDPGQRVHAALVEELSRSQKDLRLRGHEAPYFLSYAVRGIQAREVGAEYGAIFLDHVRRERRLQVDVRVGSYQFDNTGSQEMFDFDGQDSGYSAGREAPLDDDPAAPRNALWLLTDDLDKKALSAYLKKKGKEDYRPDELDRPRGDRLSRKIDEMIGELLALRAAPVLDPYTGPALLSPEAAGVLFHEAVGHRLEGERQNDDKDGRTFKGRVGKPILPGFLTIIDDPTLARFGGTSLNGVYKYDDQGVPAQRTVLVEGGVLKTFLLSRAPVAGFSQSNGHGRSSPGRDPVARMANLIVQSDRTLPLAKLKEALLAEALRQEKPFGLLIRDVTGGNTDTSSYPDQAFKGHPRLVYKGDAKTREETLVRRVDIFGSPLTSLGKIPATRGHPPVFDGY